MKKIRFSRYLALYHPPDKDAKLWGVRAIDVGYTVISPNTDYPPHHHPDSYMFTWEHGRIFSEYQFLAVTRGQGEIETASAGLLKISTGDIFVLFPGEWHRFRPDYDCGWNECWVGFDGYYARHLMQSFFLPQFPLLRGAATSDINRLMKSIVKRYKEALLDATPLLAADIIALISRLMTFARKSVPLRSHAGQSKIVLARNWLLEHAFDEMETERVCEIVNMGYSAFRKAFKDETGYAPHEYVLEVRLNRVKALLQQTDQTITQIASETGFTSVSYFTRFFTRRVGCSPSVWRKKQGILSQKGRKE